jgi:hypothetical protein
VKSPQELFRRLEREVRTPREVFPIDAFLPSPDTLPTEFPDPPPSSLPAQVREMGPVSDAEEEKREKRKQRRGRKARIAGAPAEPPKKLEDEVQEFLNRDRPPGTRPEELSEFLDTIDLSEDPEKK